jgi:aspartyl-tRNA(Asn)/glutamyl-tRNA(Gln) amidotransferase subunit C
MAVQLTATQVEAIAVLAHLELEAGEAELFCHQLTEFLGYAEEVQKVDTAGIAPTASVVTSQASARPDEVRPSLDRELALASAPDPSPAAGFFKVPRVIG